MSPRLFGHARSNSDVDFDPLPPSSAAPYAMSSSSSSLGPGAYGRSGARSGGTNTPAGGGSPTLGPVNKKLELWRRRLARAHEVLDAQGVRLYTWRRGQDVEAEAVGIVRQALEEMAREERRRRGR